MFNSKKSSDEAAGASSLIGTGTTIHGDIDTTGDIRIDGVLKGNLTGSAKVLIGPEGVVEGNVKGLLADVLGRVTGSIRVTELLHLRGKASIDGDIFAGKLQVEPTVTYNGRCHMGNAAVVEMVNIVELKAADTALAVNQ